MKQLYALEGNDIIDSIYYDFDVFIMISLIYFDLFIMISLIYFDLFIMISLIYFDLFIMISLIRFIIRLRIIVRLKQNSNIVLITFQEVCYHNIKKMKILSIKDQGW